MKHIPLSPVLGFLPLIGLAGCGMMGGDRSPEVTNAARLNVAMAAEASGDNQMALQIYAAALAKDPSDTKAAVRYARALVNNRQVGLARELLTRQLAMRPGQPDLSREFGTIEVLQGQAAAALPRFDVALEANPNDVRALVNKGIALDMLGRHPEAQELYHRADVLSPDDPAVRSNLAMSLMLQSRMQEASDVMQGMAGSATMSPRIRNNMAVMAAANGDMARARQLTSGEISDVELQSLAAQLRSLPQPIAAPVAATQPSPVAAAQRNPAAALETPAATAPADTNAAGAVPLTVPGQSERLITPASATAPHATPNRVQDKRSAGRLNMTAVTPAVVAHALEQGLEKEAAYIGQPPTASAAPGLTEHAQVLPAMALTPLRQRAVNVTGSDLPAAVTRSAAPHPFMASGPRRNDTPRFGYAVQLAAVGSESGAHQEWRTLNYRLPFLMMGREAMVERGTHPDGRAFWRLRTPGFASFSDAQQFCDDLKLAGRDCFITGGQVHHVAARRMPAFVPAATNPAPAETAPSASRAPDPV